MACLELLGVATSQARGMSIGFGGWEEARFGWPSTWLAIERVQSIDRTWPVSSLGLLWPEVVATGLVWGAPLLALLIVVGVWVTRDEAVHHGAGG